MDMTLPKPARARPRSRGISHILRNPQLRAPYLFIAPAFLIVMVFQFLPAIAGVLLSFTRFSGVQMPEWRGLQNYERMLNDNLFWNGVGVTLYYVVGTVIPSTLLALAMAMALNTRWLWIKGVIRSVYFLPSVISLVTIALVWQWMLNPSIGLANELLALVGLPKQQFLADPNQAMPIMILVGIWRSVGFNMVIYLAGLQGIDRSYYEAALVDGANQWRLFRHITWPLLWPTTFFIVAINVIAGFQLFDLVQVMTDGGPVHATRVLVLYLYDRAFGDLLFGYGSAMAVALFLLMLGFTLFQFRFFQRDIEY
ncbi:MAG TPA: sugar ABC transporter permease [Caldilineaceae bacterium]|nr:sugar ABC transporter permease [Caldilineaceae bacterium]